jgi:predicted dinucleotide-binding enzyme
MDSYRIHSLDSGGLRLSEHRTVCSDDAEAHAVAKSTISAGGIAEVWQGSRKVGTVTVPLVPDLG